MSQSAELPGRERLLELVSGMEGQPVLMLVDLVADRFISGAPKRISREAPVLILSLESDRFVPGGGANAVANVRALGGRPLALGAIGADESGRQLLAELEAREVETAGILTVNGYRTPTKTRILGGGKHSIKQQIVRFDVEDRVRLGDDERRRLAKLLEEWRGVCRVAVLSDYGYGAVLPELVEPVRRALGRDSVVLCDSRYRLADFSGIDGATPNEEEAEALAGGSFGDDPARLAAAGRGIRERLGAGFLLITRGSEGMDLFDDAGVAHVPIHGSDQVADVTGAGDTVIGAFALALAAGATPLEAAVLADYASGVVVQKLGTATLAPAELRQAVADDPRPRTEIAWRPY